MSRELSNWIDGFVEHTANTTSPEVFRIWAGIATVAAALERRVWVNVGMGPLYPNQYIIFVAPPGIGKTVMTSTVWRFLNDLDTGSSDGLHLASASLTAASAIDELRDSDRKVYSEENLLEPVRFNSLAICSDELGVLLPAYDNSMMNNLTALYDGTPYSERRRWNKDLNFKIEAPCLNMLAATTPGYLTHMLPEGAWDQGFLSRTLLIFSGERTIRPLFQFHAQEEKRFENLSSDLAEIFKLKGEFRFEPEAKAALIRWHSAGGPPVPDHPRLTNYNTRRTAHLLKLCMIASVAEGDDLIITHNHMRRGLNWLLEIETLMPDIFKSMIVNADMKAMDECWHYTFQLYLAEDRPIAEHRIVSFLSERVPVQNVMRMLQVMVNQKILEEKLVGDVGKAYVPKARGGKR